MLKDNDVFKILVDKFTEADEVTLQSLEVIKRFLETPTFRKLVTDSCGKDIESLIKRTSNDKIKKKASQVCNLACK